MSTDASVSDSSWEIAFDPTDLAEYLRHEHYVNSSDKPAWRRLVRAAYYMLRPCFPVTLRKHLQTAWLKDWKTIPFPQWPVDGTVDQMFEWLMRNAIKATGLERIPFVWFWPDGLSSCAIMTHDVETDAGLKYCGELMDMDDAYGIKSSFQLVPDARYVVSDEVRASFTRRGFEVNVHDLKHDGRLFNDYNDFRESAVRINEFGDRFESKGFRSAILYRNQDWFGELRFSYDMSVPNVGHLDPQRGGCCTVMPYFVGDILEIPVTTTQDYSLFHVLQTYSHDLWAEQISQIMKRHGLISFIVHPDYLNSDRAVNTYKLLLQTLADLRDQSGLWTALPRDVDTWWRQRSNLELHQDGEQWKIRGEGAERARLAFARLEQDRVVYELA